jgi:hypothetical protein
MYDYEALKRQALEELAEFENNPDIQAALNKTLHNKSEKTDYRAWVRGAERAAQNNYDVLKKWIS